LPLYSGLNTDNHNFDGSERQVILPVEIMPIQ
jgi:hypothetical protein